MKASALTRLSVFILLVALLSVSPAIAQSPPISAQAVLGTAFTYQGHLSSGGLPANGAYDFRFTLFAASADVTPLAGPIEVPDVDVADGTFTASLDFGAVFDGSERWLEVTVRPGASLDAYTTLTPRTLLGAVPYAHALRWGAGMAGAGRGLTLAGGNDVGATLKVSNGDPADTYVLGKTAIYGLSRDGTGVFGASYSLDTSGVAGTSWFGMGVNGYSVEGTGVYAASGAGIALRAAGTGIISSSAETKLSLNPFDLEKSTELAGTLTFLHHWAGYNQIQRTDGSGSATVYLPANSISQLFGSQLKLKSLEVCYQTSNAATYIDQTRVYYFNGTGGRTEILLDQTNRTSTAWNCYSVTNAVPVAIDGPLLAHLNIWFANTAHTMSIGRITAMLVE